MNIIQRVQSPTPKHFKLLRTIGIVLAAVGGTVVASPIALPAIVVTIGGYITLAGSVIGAVSQTAVSNE